MNKNLIKYTSYFTVIILLFYMVMLPYVMPSAFSTAQAASINGNEVSKGIILALLLILVSKIGKRVIHSEKQEINSLPASNDLPSEEVELLAKAINAEARGEPYEGQVAVGAVILNRMKDSQFPDSIREIVYQNKQFSSVNDGQINLIPGPSAYKAAYDALDGKDPTHNALYFYNPSTADHIDWFEKNTSITVRIGDHVFAR